MKISWYCYVPYKISVVPFNVLFLKAKSCIFNFNNDLFPSKVCFGKKHNCDITDYKIKHLHLNGN